jgi:hypothetical protein
LSSLKFLGSVDGYQGKEKGQKTRARQLSVAYQIPGIERFSGSGTLSLIPQVKESIVGSNILPPELPSKSNSNSNNQTQLTDQLYHGIYSL